MLFNTATYYYKIFESALPEPLPETLPATDLDKESGFIHLSTAEQTPVTADRHFSQHKTLYLLKLRVSKLDGMIDIDDKAGRGCPHLRDSKVGLGKSNIEEVIVVQRGENEKWSEVKTMTELEN